MALRMCEAIYIHIYIIYNVYTLACQVQYINRALFLLSFCMYFRYIIQSVLSLP